MKKYYKLSDEKLINKIEKTQRKSYRYAALTITSYLLTGISFIGAVGCALLGIPHVALAFVVGLVWQIISIVGFTFAGVKTCEKEDEMRYELERREEEDSINDIIEHIVENLDDIFKEASSEETKKVENKDNKKEENVDVNQKVTEENVSENVKNQKQDEKSASHECENKSNKCDNDELDQDDDFHVE